MTIIQGLAIKRIWVIFLMGAEAVIEDGLKTCIVCFPENGRVGVEEFDPDRMVFQRAFHAVSLVVSPCSVACISKKSFILVCLLDPE